MRCAILKLASEPSVGPDRLVSLAINATTERRASEHPPPTASRTSGQKVRPAWVHLAAAWRNVFLRDSTEAKTPAMAVGSARAGPIRKALVMEESHASWPPLGPRGTQTSARRRDAVPGSRGVRVRGAVIVDGILWNQEARLFQNSARLALSLAVEWTMSRGQIATPASQSGVAPFVHNMIAKCAVAVVEPDGHAETTAEAHAEQGSRDAGLKRVGKCKEPCTGPRDAIEAETLQTIALQGTRTEQVRAGLGFNLG